MQLASNTEKFAAFLQRCRDCKLKITPQRTSIFKAVMNSTQHPSTDVIYKAIHREFPNISFDTVNRTLLTFYEIGIIEIVEGHGDPRRFDPNLDMHHHFYCIKCGQIFDIMDADLGNINISNQLTQEFTIVTQRIVLKGFCKTCKETKYKGQLY